MAGAILFIYDKICEHCGQIKEAKNVYNVVNGQSLKKKLHSQCFQRTILCCCQLTSSPPQSLCSISIINQLQIIIEWIFMISCT